MAVRRYVEGFWRSFMRLSLNGGCKAGATSEAQVGCGLSVSMS